MRIITQLVELIAPAECLGCGIEGAILCPDCFKGSVKRKAPSCYRCNRLSLLGRTCDSCRNQTALAGVTVASYYDGTIKALIQAIKYGGMRDGATVAARLVAPLLDATAFDLVTSVPTAAGRYRTRGYNQAELIGRGVSRQTQLPYLSLLTRLGRKRQVGAARRQRLSQLQDSFVAKRTTALKGQRILLIDDVLTTGATMAECAQTLRAAGAARVWGAVVAKH